MLIEQWNGRLAFPGGTGKRGESAQCTAHRETWEETGLAVSVGLPLVQFANGFMLYRCHAPLIDSIEKLTAPATIEVRDIHWLDENALREFAWRFPAQQQFVADFLVQHKSVPPAEQK